MHIGDYLGRRALYTPDRIGIVDAGKSPAWRLTFAALNERANRFANWLRDAAGIGHGDRVAILARDGLEHGQVGLGRAAVLDALAAPDEEIVAGGDTGEDTGAEPGASGGTLIWAHEQEPPDLHLDDPTNNLSATSWIRSALLEGLYGISGSTEYYPELLAEDNAPVDNGDGSVTVNYVLREGLKWSDGDDLTAEFFMDFDDVFGGRARPWHCGILWDRDPRLALPLLAALRAELGLVVGDNEPYSGRHPADYTVDTHGERHGRPHVCIEVRQDLLAEDAGVATWADRLASPLAALLADASLYRAAGIDGGGP